ncbi:MAG: tRNA (adenosine(37)-N6)-dimethylallyltransferase MiaA [Anaerolineaceae bacterium]|nr:tRNA (adenosine(37)-N6)-dimethylallyltransferase MiaA [Anaerolineaceae bacterium]
MSKQPYPKLLMVVGPTASGKSELAIQIAEKIPAEIISADSRSFYRELRIGVAKPSLQDRKRAIHHLIDVGSIDAPWSLGQFQKETSKLVKQISARQKLPILVGGTGQYMRAISENWEVPELVADEKLRNAIQHWGECIGFNELHEKLKVVDPVAAAGIDFRNHRRTIRAFEVLLISGKRFSEQRRAGEAAYDLMTIGLEWNREALYARVDERIRRMFENGLAAEVHDLAAAGKAEQMRRIGVIGYSEVLDYLEGKHSLEEAIRLIERNTRKFIRHQSNWFKADDPSIEWFKANDPELMHNVLGHIQDWLSK